MSSLVVLMIVQLFAVLYFLNFKKHLTNKQISIYASVVFFISIIALLVITKIVLRSELDSFDTNNDGFFNGREINSEQQDAASKVTSDAHLILAPLVAVLYSGVYFIMLFIGLKIFRKTPSNQYLNSTD